MALSLFNKLNFKNQDQVLVINAPGSFNESLKELPSGTSVITSPDSISKLDFAMVFVTKLQEINKTISNIAPKLDGDATLWFCYPKSTSKNYKCDFNRDTGWAELGKYNLEGVRQVSIDGDWSALRFRKIEYIKNFTRSKRNALSNEGKKRAR